jgi:hypothetical protein
MKTSKMIADLAMIARIDFASHSQDRSECESDWVNLSHLTRMSKVTGSHKGSLAEGRKVSNTRQKVDRPQRMTGCRLASPQQKQTSIRTG